jgi:hypothetical protein
MPTGTTRANRASRSDPHAGAQQKGRCEYTSPQRPAGRRKTATVAGATQNQLRRGVHPASVCNGRHDRGTHPHVSPHGRLRSPFIKSPFPSTGHRQVAPVEHTSFCSQKTLRYARARVREFTQIFATGDTRSLWEARLCKVPGPWIQENRIGQPGETLAEHVPLSRGHAQSFRQASTKSTA